MKVVLAGAFGHLGTEILKELVSKGHKVIAADLKETKIEGLRKSSYKFVQIDATKPETMEGLCDKADAVITTMGLTSASTRFSAYDIDYLGNMYLLKEAINANVKVFNYVSVLSCDEKDAEKVPMLHAKRLFEDELMKTNMQYVIYRPTGYFYDIVKVFKPFVEKGEMQLLKGYLDIKANVVDCNDFASFIVKHMNNKNKIYEVGGKETYTYPEMAKICFHAAGKPVIIKETPAFMYDILAMLPKIKKQGKRAIMLFGKWTMTHNLVGKDVTGKKSFKKYCEEYFGGNK